eukprot:TRINITY_DN1826_c0_g2_i2.p1 TRINITY_DN1826_c0_g2~~TRINITY_DN1826_c0_g2_i2.p1  ORF type:complete len:1028 (-),score=189.76 TRINITY_DN1826_c0_g2_i2:42-3056(-)
MVVTKEIPWCTVFLCGGAALCHTIVWIGNMKTASSFNDMGKSVNGWSEVGLATAESLHSELDGLLGNVTFQLTDAINRTLSTQDMIDQMLSMMGTAGAAAAAKGVQHVALLQTHGEDVGNPMDAIMKVVTKALGALPSFQDALVTMQGMMQNLKPALLQVGIWVETFAAKVQGTVETFGTTMDRVQKLFDNIMSKTSPTAGENAEDMLHETFNLFDMDGSGKISESDLNSCADLYAVNAIKGDKAKELLDKYDSSGDGELDITELGLLVEDPSIVGIMATVLRSYAKRLSMVAGQVGAARMRDEVALNVVRYFQLVCSKNLTKVGWVSDMLTNGTLPMEFTADVMAELALEKDNPNILTTADVGEIVVGMMMTIDQEYTLKAVDMMSSAEHWEKEGYEPDDQPKVVEAVTAWTLSGPDAVAKLKEQMETRKARSALLEGSFWNEHVAEEEELLARERRLALDKKSRVLHDVMAAMPPAARRLSRQRVELHTFQRYQRRAEKRLKLFNTDAKRLLLDRLLHGIAAQDGGPMDAALKALSKGVEAKPETKEFAQWLKNNASQTADRFQSMCMDYTGQSSSALDAFNTQIQGMVKKISGFIDIMKEHATPAGIQKLEDVVNEFAANAMEDVFKIVGGIIVNALGGDADMNIFGGDSNSTNESAVLIEFPWLKHKDDVRDVSLLEIAKPRRVHRSHLQSHTSFKSNHSIHAHGARLVLERSHFEEHSKQLPPQLAGVWEQATTTLRQLQKILPPAIDLLKFARTEVSAVSANLDSIFSGLKSKGVPIFATVASLYGTIWTAYYVFTMGLTLGILWYGFWASGYCGGPQPLPKEDEEYEPPSGFFNRMKACCSACCRCCSKYHDTQTCFWSFILVFQLIVLLLFVMSIVFVVIAGVQIFTGSSCAQIYLLSDTKVCTETLGQLATFMSTFQVSGGEVPLSMSCEHYNLKTCELVNSKMFSSAVMTVAGSFVAVVFSFELIFEVAMIHERVRWRRVINEIEAETSEKVAS